MVHPCEIVSYRKSDRVCALRLHTRRDLIRDLFLVCGWVLGVGCFSFFVFSVAASTRAASATSFNLYELFSVFGW